MTKLNLIDAISIEITIEFYLKCLDQEINQTSELTEKDKIQKESFITLKESISETYAKIEKFLSEVGETQFLTEEDITNLNIELEDTSINEEEIELADNSDMLQIYDINMMRNIFTENVRQMAFDKVIERLHELGLHDVVGSEEEIRKMLVGALMQDTIKKGLEKGYL